VLYHQAFTAAKARSGITVYRLLADCRSRDVPCHDAYLHEYYRLPEHLTEFRALAWDVYIDMKIDITSNISTALGIGNGTLAIVSSINFPAGHNFRSASYSFGGRASTRTSRLSYANIHCH